MAQRAIVVYPDPVLLEPTRKVERFDDDLRQLVKDMTETMYAADGIGLAANQVGVPLRLFIVDLSHASEESCHDVLASFEGALVASHSNPRRICAGERQLSDAVIRGLAERGGMIGIVPYGGHLVEDWRESGCPPVPLRRVGEAIHCAVEIAGTHRVVGIGSDFDGGFGAERTPEGLDTVADLPRLADTMTDFGFGDEMIYDILGRNWIRFFQRTLPAA